jgi:hypothetical protein
MGHGYPPGDIELSTSSGYQTPQFTHKLVYCRALAGVLLTTVTTFFANRQKIKEIELEYKHKLDEIYRTNARQYIDPLYKPLNRILTKLEGQYDAFLRGRYACENIEELDTSDEERLKQAFEEFFASVSELLSDGDSGYLTLELDEALSDFSFFLKNSLHVKGPVGLSLEIRAFIVLYRPFILFLKRNIRKGIEEELRYPRAASIYTQGFRDRFLYDVRKIRNLIREVMLKNNVVNPI